ncbi:MAG TPA: CehA/McbA family metallohydrolase [Trebonia sp.]|nr:CehA/McbA family metallohydrolase [Trebonia sp.]
MGRETEHRGRWSLEDRFSSVYQYLPVEVPPGTAALRVALEYERAGAVIDLGCLGPMGFRGWSGGARESFVVAAGDATPGYLPGELEPGLWQVMLGLHQLPPDGTAFRVIAEVSHRDAGWLPPVPAAPPAPAGRPEARSLPARPGYRWLAGDLHSHTVHSDGALTVPELAELAVRRGLDFLAVTDHNTVSHHGQLAAAARRYGIALLAGQEVTTAFGHANVFGDVGWIDFRNEADDWLEAAERAGGLMSVNHPIAGPVAWLRSMRRRPPLVEVWHWSWLDLSWTIPLSWWQAWSPAAIPVGGSDWHREGSDAPVGQPTTWIEVPSEAAAAAGAKDGAAIADPAAILLALRGGRVAISATRDAAVLLRADDHPQADLVAVAADGLILAGPEGPCLRVSGQVATLPGAPGYHRLLDSRGATVALTP